MNKTTYAVRQRARPSAPKGGEDRRVRRTTHALIQALVTLVLEKRYDAITIQDLLNRADVGRSTFYSHFRGKDDLLLRSFEGMLEALDQAMGPSGPANPRVAPVRELFQHVGEFRRFHQALARAHMGDRLYQCGTNQLSRSIERRLATFPAGPGAVAVPAAVKARALAGSLFALLGWWVDQDAPYTPEQMDDMYHAIRLTS